MKLKISLFDRTIIKSDLKRFWWVSALYGVILFFSLPLQHMLQVLPLKEEWQKEALLNSLRITYNGAPRYSISRIDMQVLLICTVPVFLAVLLFGYLHSARAATVLHSLPPERKTLFGSHVSAGILLISAPVFLTAVIMALLAAFTGLGQYYTVLNVFEWMCLTLLYHMLFFSIAVFVGMFTGNAAAHIVFTYIINVLPYTLYMLVAYNLEILLRGFGFGRLDSGWAQALPLIKVVGFTFKEFTLAQGLLYLLIAFVFLVAAGVAYRARKLETAGNIVTFRIIRPFFKYGVTICLMLAGGFLARYLGHSERSAVIVALFIFGFIGYWLSQMLLEKTVKVWHAYKGFLIFNAVIILLLAGISADVTGYVKRVPKLDEVEAAYYGYSYHRLQQEKDKVSGADNLNLEGFFREKENIKAVMSLHTILAASKKESDGQPYYIAYLLKNGGSIVRRYAVDTYALRKLLEPLYEAQEYKEAKFPVLRQEARDVKLLEIGDRRTGKKPLILSEEEQMQSFINVLKKELAEADYEEVTEPEDEYAYIRIIEKNDRSVQYGLRRSFGELHSWLSVNGYYDAVMLSPEDIDHVAIQRLQVNRYKEGGFSYGPTGSSLDVNDRAVIEELLAICHSRPNLDKTGIYFQLNFYSNVEAVRPDFDGYIYSDTAVSEGLRKKLEELGMDPDAAMQ